MLNIIFLILFLVNFSTTQPNVDFYNTGAHLINSLPAASSYNNYASTSNSQPYSSDFDFNKYFQSSNFPQTEYSNVNAIPSSASSYYSSSPQSSNSQSYGNQNVINELPSVNTANLAGQDPNILSQYLKFVESVQTTGTDNIPQMNGQNLYVSSPSVSQNSKSNVDNTYLGSSQVSVSPYQPLPPTMGQSGYSVPEQSSGNSPSSQYVVSNTYTNQNKVPLAPQMATDYSKTIDYSSAYTNYAGPSQNVYNGQKVAVSQTTNPSTSYQNTANNQYLGSQQNYVAPSVTQKPYGVPEPQTGYNNQISSYTNDKQYIVNNQASNYIPSNINPSPKTYNYVPPVKPTAAPQVEITPAPIYPSSQYNGNYNIPSTSSSNYNYQNAGVRNNNQVQPVVYPNSAAFNGVSNNQQVNTYQPSIQQPVQRVVQATQIPPRVQPAVPIQVTQSPIKIQPTTSLQETDSYNVEPNIYNYKMGQTDYSSNSIQGSVNSIEKEDNFYVPESEKSIYENVEDNSFENTNSLPGQSSSYKQSVETTGEDEDISSKTSVSALTQQIKRLPAVFYADSTDPNTQRIENMLRDTYGLPLVTFYLDKIDDTNTVEKNLQTLTAHKGAPYLFICGTFIGSQQHIDNYKDNKQIPQLVEYVCGDQKHRHRSKRHDANVSFPKVMLFANNKN
uniref:Glutaredoxin domain-containing protein n=1 Tax=Parastrongyloides trichosuri TaxID=131310 RepID=A0A0N4Z281_PARTI